MHYVITRSPNPPPCPRHDRAMEAIYGGPKSVAFRCPVEGCCAVSSRAKEGYHERA